MARDKAQSGMEKLVKRFSYISKKLLGKTVAGRRLTVLADDVYLTSYPRSGNTWTRFLIANLLYDDKPTNFSNIEERIPEIYLFSNRQLLQRPRPRVLKSHEYFDPRYPKVIYIVRDPRDVAVSVFHYSIKRRDIPEQYPIEEFVPRFISGEFFVDFASWGDHVSSWIYTRGLAKKHFLLLRYEDMQADPCRELAKVVSFLQLELPPERLARAAELSSADRMRKLEELEGRDWQLTKDTRSDKKFVRKAEAGSWRNELPQKCIQEIETGWRSLMQTLGYDLTTTEASTSASVLSFAKP